MLAEILNQLPRDLAAPIVIAQHIDEGYVAGLAKWLGDQTTLPVEVAVSGGEPRSGHVYLAASQQHLAVRSDGRLQYVNEPSSSWYHPSVDVLFSTAARHWPLPGIAALLTGMGRDGANGLADLRRAGWTTIAQDQATSVVWGMPKAAFDLGAAEFVLPSSQIAAHILSDLKRAKVRPTSNRRSMSMNVENDSASARVTVLLIDDQPFIGEAVRRMIAGEPDIDFHYLQNPLQAIQTAHSVHPTVILQDLVMPEVDGLDLVTQFRAQDFTREIPMIVLSTKEEATTKAKAFAVGANDYLVKLPDRIELLARIRYHSKGYINLLQRNEAYRALAEQRQKLADEIDSAAKYVQSLLPAKIQDGPVRADWQFIPVHRPFRRYVRLSLARRTTLHFLSHRRCWPRCRGGIAFRLGAECDPISVAAGCRLSRPGPSYDGAKSKIPDVPAIGKIFHWLVWRIRRARATYHLRRRRASTGIPDDRRLR